MCIGLCDSGEEGRRVEGTGIEEVGGFCGIGELGNATRK